MILLGGVDCVAAVGADGWRKFSVCTLQDIALVVAKPGLIV